MSTDQTTRKPPDRDALQKQRDAVIMEIVSNTGLNATEISSLRIRDVELEAGRLFVCAWRGTRTEPLGPMLRDNLCQYIRYIRPEIGTCTGEDALFVSLCEAKSMTPRHVQETINDNIRQAKAAKLQAIAERMKGGQL